MFGSGERYLRKIGLGVLVATVAFVTYLITNYQIVWAQPENFVKRDIVLQTSYSTAGAVLLETFNWSVWEAGAPRLTRLMSSLFDVIDTHFRNWFNSNIFPHPSISVTWLFSLFLSPVYLYRGLRLVRCEKDIAIYCLAVYFSLPGVLSLVVMGFRPGKSIALFFIIYIMYLMLKISETSGNVRNREIPALTLAEFHVVAVLAVALFADEIAVFALAPVLLMHHYRCLKSVALPILATLVVVIYSLFTRFILPAIHSWAGFPVTCEGLHCLNGQYNLQAKLVAIIFSDSTSLFYISKIIWLNLLNAIRDNAGIALLWDSTWSLHWWIGCATLLGLGGFSGYSLLNYNGIFRNSSGWRGVNGAQLSLLFGISIIFHGILMSLTDHVIWGVY